MKKTYEGSCHCRAVRFGCELDLAAGSTRCNCSFCGKARFWMTFVKKSDFRLLAGEADLTDYRHTPPGREAPFLHLTFCKHCGMRPFSHSGDGRIEALGGEFYAVNVACLDGLTDEERGAIPVSFVDGRAGAWDRSPAVTTML
jgi:hypothetical protein